VRARTLLGLLALVACSEIQGRSLSQAPLNACPDNPCEAYKGGAAKASCQNGRCEISGGLASFFIVVSVPETSFFAPGATFIITSKDLVSGTPVKEHPLCRPPACLSLPDLGVAGGVYQAAGDAASAVGLATPKDSGLPSVPMRLTFFALTAPAVDALSLGLPSPVVFTASRIIQQNVRYEVALPAGRYLRLAEPEPPWDKYLPPLSDEIVVREQLPTLDDFTLTTNTLDDPTPEGLARQATITRAEGLEGFRVWIFDPKAGRRVSVVKPLSGTQKTVRLDTHRQRAGDYDTPPPAVILPSLRDQLDMVIAPPDDWIAVPRFEASITPTGVTLGDFEYPALGPPIQHSGSVVDTTQGQRLGIPSRVTWTSRTIIRNAVPDTNLHYTTTVTTDAHGRFETVLPRGSYDVMVDPVEGTGYSRFSQIVELPEGQTIPSTLEAPKRSHARGIVHIADGRPLGGAQVVASPSRTQTPAPGQTVAVVPRATATTTNMAGEFELSVDRGAYELSIIPELGTGLPRLVQVTVMTGDDVDLGDSVVPAPFKLAFTIREPSSSALPVPHAIVQIFAPKGDPPSQVAVGTAITDASGKVEFLLAD
jgi:hypothetical protein